MNASKHYLIVGAGLAGICVAWHLRKKGHQVTIVDNGQNKSSVIAAGMINPLVFRRMTKSWRVDEFLPYANSFYSELETSFAVKFHNQITIRRIFSSAQERGFWEEKQHLPEFANYMTPITNDDDLFYKSHNPFGTGRVKAASVVDASNFVKSAQHYFSEQKCILHESFDHDAFIPTQLKYKSKTYDAVVFCEGFSSKTNPLFAHLPIQQTKGETITIQCSELKTSESLNRKCFVLPLGNDLYRVGATYVWNTSEDNITDEATKELREKFSVISDLPYAIVEQKAGIRPTTPDRRPIIGEHPELHGIFIFNGLGTKGYMSAPLLSHEFCEHLTEGALLSEELSLARFKKG